MDKGIRQGVNRLFMERLPQREHTPAGNLAFRKGITTKAMEDFGCTLGAAASHYNHAFIKAREKAKTDPQVAQWLEGLGRPEDKKGGRKKKVQAVAPQVQVEGAVSEVLESNVLSNNLAFNVLPNTEAAANDEQPPAEAPPQLEAPQPEKPKSKKGRKAAEQQPAA